MPTNAKKIRIGGVSHDIEDTAARTSIGTLSSLKTTAKTNLVSAVNEVFDSVDGLGETYAKQDGYYQDMTVGDAEQLVSSMVVDDSAPYKFRTSGGSADIGNRAYMDKIVGGTVAWNQQSKLAQNWSMNWGSGTVSRGDNEFTVANAPSESYAYNGTTMQVAQGHVILVTCLVKASGGTAGIYFGYGSDFARADTSSNSYTPLAVMRKETRSSGSFEYSIQFRTYSACESVSFKSPQIFDLTQMFGSTIADYIYSLEQSTAGAGVAFFRSLFPDPYYEYNAGELISVSGLQSHNTVGFNAWDEEWEIGFWNQQGEKDIASTAVRSTNYIRVIPGANYYIKTPYNLIIRRFDAQKVLVGTSVIQGDNTTLSIPADTSFIVFCSYTFDNITSINPGDICINLSHSGARNGEYEPYKKHSYPLDSSLTLRGIPKLDSSNQLYWDGDEYAPDGTVTRRYGVVDLGTLTWSKDSNRPGVFYSSTGASDRKKDGAVISTNYSWRSLIVPSATDLQDANQTISLAASYGGGYIFIIDIAKANMTATEFTTAMSGVYAVYELATPTTETADAYQQIQNVDDYGTEEFVSTSIVPVGHVTRYPANLRDKLQHLPDLAASDGTYVILQSGSQMTLAPLTMPTELPAAPSTDGTYTLKATVSNGAVTYSWGA